jgi:hypothetical protein
MSETKQLIYLLKALEDAGEKDNPAEHDYLAKRNAVLDYVASSERELAATTEQDTRWNPEVIARELGWLPDSGQDVRESIPPNVLRPKRQLAASHAEGENNHAKMRELDAMLIAALKAQKIAELKASASLANNLCPDHRDKQSGRQCLACLLEQAIKAKEETERLLRELLTCKDLKDDAERRILSLSHPQWLDYYRRKSLVWAAVRVKVAAIEGAMKP